MWWQPHVGLFSPARSGWGTDLQRGGLGWARALVFSEDSQAIWGGGDRTRGSERNMELQPEGEASWQRQDQCPPELSKHRVGLEVWEPMGKGRG